MKLPTGMWTGLTDWFKCRLCGITYNPAMFGPHRCAIDDEPWYARLLAALVFAQEQE